jgi:hypothetical protein
VTSAGPRGSPLPENHPCGLSGRRGSHPSQQAGESSAISSDGVDPQHAIRYELRVNGVFDGAGNRSPASSVTLANQTC